MILLGNVIIALLLSFSVVIIGVFDLYPAINAENQLLASLFSILLDYAILLS
jgi:4-hydroxybenzoate polyprenyltransferase